MTIYENYKYLTNNPLSKSIKIFLITNLILISILILIINIPFKKYKSFTMTLLKENIYEIYLTEKNIDLFKNTLFYNNKKYSFEIIEIDPNYYLNTYRRITISVNFKINIPNKIYEILVYEKKSKLLNELLKEVLWKN